MILSKRTLINLALLALIVLLSIYIQKNPVKRITTAESFTDLQPEEVDTIVIQRKKDAIQVILEKTEGGWMITSPIDSAKASPEIIEHLLGFLKLKSRHQHKITDPRQLQRYELNDPKITLFLNDQQFDFGNTNSFNHLRYVLHDNVVHSIKDITYHILNADVESFQE